MERFGEKVEREGHGVSEREGEIEIFKRGNVIK